MKRAPSYRNPPAALNEAATDIWRWVVKHYADDIYESKAMRDQWRKAKSHFERICANKGIPPYTEEASLMTLAAKIERLARSL